MKLKIVYRNYPRRVKGGMFRFWRNYHGWYVTPHPDFFGIGPFATRAEAQKELLSIRSIDPWLKIDDTFRNGTPRWRKNWN